MFHKIFKLWIYWILYRYNLFQIIIIIYKLSLSTCKYINIPNQYSFFNFLNLYFLLILNENTNNLNLKIKSINVGILHFIEIIYLIPITLNVLNYLILKVIINVYVRINITFDE